MLYTVHLKRKIHVMQTVERMQLILGGLVITSEVDLWDMLQSTKKMN